MVDILLTHESLSVNQVFRGIERNDAGGTVIFIGTVRDNTKGKRVIKLEFEAYEAMAVAEMRKIAHAILQRWSVLGVSIHHRLGTLTIGEIPVIIAVVSAHRQEAFEACQYAIDTLKQTVPIWKKEVFEDGDVWVAAHP